MARPRGNNNRPSRQNHITYSTLITESTNEVRVMIDVRVSTYFSGSLTPVTSMLDIMTSDDR